MDGVLLRKPDGERALEGVEVGEEGVDEGGGCGAFEEESGLWVLIGKRGSFGKDASRAGGLGLTVGLLRTFLPERLGCG